MAGPDDQYCPHETRGLVKGDRVFCYCSLLKQGSLTTVWAGLTNRLNIVAAKKQIRYDRARGLLQDKRPGHCEGME